MAGRHSAAVLASFAGEHRRPCRMFSLNDPSGEHGLTVGGRSFSFRGCGASKIRFAAGALRAAGSKPHLVFAGHPNLAVPAAALRFVSRNSRVLVVAHGVEVWTALPFFRRAALRRADLVLGPSRYTCGKLASIQGVPAGKIRLLPWALDPDFLALCEPPNRLPLPQGFPKGRVILTVGRWSSGERYKGMDHLIEILRGLAEEFPDLHLVAVGEGDDRARLEKLAEEHAARGRVHFFEGLTRPQLAACYAQAEIFALPSGGEGFGLVFLEAMAFGKPVVGTKSGGIPDVVEDGVTGLLTEYGDRRQLAGAIQSLLRSESLRMDFGHRGQDRVRKEFTFDTFHARLAKILSEAGRTAPAGVDY